MDADDLRRRHGRQVDRVGDGDGAAVAGHQLVAVADDVDGVAVEQDAPGLAQGHGCLLGWGLSPRPAGRARPSGGRSRGRRASPWPREAIVGPVEPQVHLAGADRVLVVAVLPCSGGAGLLAEGADHHQVVGEHRLGPEPHELRHRVEDPGVVARLEPLDPLLVGRARLRRADVLEVGGSRGRAAGAASRTCGTARPRPAAAPCGRSRRSPRRSPDRRAGSPPRRRSGRPHRDPALVEALAEELPEVERGVVQRQVRVVDRGDPGRVPPPRAASIAQASSGSPRQS